MKPDPQALDEIAYAAFQTHYQSNNAQAKTGHTAVAYWKGQPSLQTLWRGIVKGVITNVVAAQTEGRIPHILLANTVEVPPGLLPGLGAPLPTATRPGPADVARKLAQHVQAKAHAAEAAGDPRKAAQDAAPGLAIGRCTEGPQPEKPDDDDEGEVRMEDIDPFS